MSKWFNAFDITELDSFQADVEGRIEILSRRGSTIANEITIDLLEGALQLIQYIRAERDYLNRLRDQWKDAPPESGKPKVLARLLHVNTAAGEGD